MLSTYRFHIFITDSLMHFVSKENIIERFRNQLTKFYFFYLSKKSNYFFLILNIC